MNPGILFVIAGALGVGALFALLLLLLAKLQKMGETYDDGKRA